VPAVGPAGEVEAIQAEPVYGGERSLAFGAGSVVIREGLAGLGQLDTAQLDADDIPLLREPLGERYPREPAAQDAWDEDNGLPLSLRVEGVHVHCLLLVA
jgi:hypothetical protein